jgi:ABC-2 type transport system permease protein
LFFVSTVLGVISLASLGLIIGGISLRMARHFDSLGDAFAGAFYLFTGAIFPLDVLPEFLRPIGFALPVTYWLELARRALLGPTAAKFPTLAGYSDKQLLGILAVMTAILAIFSWFFYHWIFHQAKENGIIDMETSF